MMAGMTILESIIIGGMLEENHGEAKQLGRMLLTDVKNIGTK